MLLLQRIRPAQANARPTYQILGESPLRIFGKALEKSNRLERSARSSSGTLRLQWRQVDLVPQRSLQRVRQPPGRSENTSRRSLQRFCGGSRPQCVLSSRLRPVLDARSGQSGKGYSGYVRSRIRAGISLHSHSCLLQPNQIAQVAVESR